MRIIVFASTDVMAMTSTPRYCESNTLEFWISFKLEAASLASLADAALAVAVILTLAGSTSNMISSGGIVEFIALDNPSLNAASSSGPNSSTVPSTKNSATITGA